jgi:RNA polymerase sigma-70 factor (ECF subfamily)
MVPPPKSSIDPHGYEAFVRLFVAHEARLRAFLRVQLPSWGDLDEVMQETGLVAWRKFATFDPATDFLKWVATIGRFEALKARRAKARDRLVFSDELCELLAEEAAAESETLEAQRRVLELCLGKLVAPQRELLTAAYEPGAKFHEVAARAGKSATAFYKIVQRLRAMLLECVQRELRTEGAA